MICRLIKFITCDCGNINIMKFQKISTFNEKVVYCINSKSFSSSTVSLEKGLKFIIITCGGRGLNLKSQFLVGEEAQISFF